MSKSYTHIVGIDEAGRGPLAGPIAVAGVCVSIGTSLAFLSGIKDSKKLTRRGREMWHQQITGQETTTHYVSMVGSSTIDTVGIVGATQQALARVLKKLVDEPEKTRVLLDGGLYAPSRFTIQKTIIRGDESEPLIAAASIIAKVRRDSFMIRAAEQYPEYGFERHKGYGTALHKKTIQKHGFCALHRKTFCT